MILTSKVINYTRSGFVALSVDLSIQSTSDFQKLKEIVLKVADEDPLIMPKVDGDERSAIAKLLEVPAFKSMFEHRHDMSALDPQVVISDISESRVDVKVKFWIREINRKEEIISGFLKELGSRLDREGVKLLA